MRLKTALEVASVRRRKYFARNVGRRMIRVTLHPDKISRLPQRRETL